MNKKIITAISLFLLLVMANVDADSLIKTLTVTTQPISYYFDGQKSNETTPGSYFNGVKNVPLSIIYDGTTYVPLRYIGEKLGKEVGWDQPSKSIWVGKKPTSFGTAPTQTSASNTSKSFFGIAINQSSDEVKKLLGEPNRIDKSKLGYDWWIYNKSYTQYIQVGIKGGKVVDLYSDAPELSFSDGLKLGDTKTQLQKVYTLNSTIKLSYDNANFEIENDLTKRPIVLVNSIPTIFYIDIHDQNKITAIRSMTVENLVKSQSYSFRYTYTKNAPNIDPPALTVQEQEQVNRANEKQIFDLANVVRQRNKLDLLAWNEDAAKVARGHSLDMLTNQYFDHTSATTGLDPFQRMERQGITYQTAGENIAMGQLDGIEAHEGWMNSLGHRKNILNKDFKTLGVGVQMNYYTQDFVTY